MLLKSIKFPILSFSTLFVFYFLSTLAFSQNRSSSYEGTHFFVGFMQNEISIDPRYGGLHLKIFISTITTCDISIIFPPDSIVKYNSVSSKSTLEIEVPLQYESYISEVAEHKAIEIISTSPIVVYAFSTQYLTSDGYSAIPIEQWGKEYVIISYPNDQYLDWEGLSFQDSLYKATPRQSEFMIIGGYDSTEITFYSKAITERGAQINSPRSITIHRGQCYLVKSFPYSKGFGDLTGTLIQGNKPFGVLSGHVRSAVPQNLVPKWDSKNHLVEMLMPVISWGREFITVPYGTGPRGDLIRIVGYLPNTTITSIGESGSFNYVINSPRNFIDVPYVAEPRRWISDKPVQIAQIMMRSGTDDDYSNYDPAMAIVPPVEQFVNNINFQTPENIAWNPNQFLGHYINIIGTFDSLDSIKLNNTLIKNINSNINIFPLFGGTYFWANIKLSRGKYQISTPKGKFTGMIFGAGLADAYSIVLGSSLTNPYIYDSIPPVISYKDDCGNITATIKDSNDANSSGIGYVFIITDSTFNYSYTIPLITENTTEVTLTARVIDLNQKGQIFFEARDRNGNFYRFKYSYVPPQIKYSPEVLFDNLKPYDSLAQKVKLLNLGRNISILDIRLKNRDPRLLMFVRDRLPIYLNNNDSTEIVISVVPNGSILDLYDSLIISLDCDISIIIPIKVNPFVAKLKVIGYDFGKIPVGDSAWGFVQIINLSNSTVKVDSIFILSFQNVFSKFDDSKVNLKPNDTAKYKILFVPKDRQKYNSKVIFYDELQLNLSAEISGEGISPEVASLFIDFGKVRVGRFKDTTVYLKNVGNADAEIFFEKYDQQSISFDSIGFIFNKNILAGDSTSITLRFIPSDTGKAIASASYLVDWPRHPKVSVVVTGIGTLPAIRAFSVSMDTIFVDSTVINIKPIALSYGNEDLYIIKISPIFGDTSSFEIDYNSFQGITLPIDSFLMIPIQFAPKFINEHILALEIISDATPGWGIKIDTIYITGFALPRDTIKALVSLKKDSNFEKLCNVNSALLTISNEGKIPFVITNIEFQFSNLSLQENDSSIYSLPFKVEPQDSLIKRLSFVFPEKGKSYLIVFVTINDTLTISDTLNFDVDGLTQFLQINLPKNKIEVFGNYELLLSGKFTEPSYEPFEFKILIEINLSQIYFDWNKSFHVFFSNSYTNWEKNVQINKDGNKFIIDFGKLVLNGEPTEWKLQLPVRALFSSEITGDLRVSAIPSFCFDTSVVSFQYFVSPVCAQDFRGIVASGIDFRSIFPNPTEDNITLEYYSFENSFANLKIINKFGYCLMEEKFELKIGLNLKNFDISFLPNGLYLFKLQSNDHNKHFILIKTK